MLFGAGALPSHDKKLETALKRPFVTRLTVLILVFLLLLIYVFPYAFLVSTSLKPPNEALAIPPTILPKQIGLENYRNIGEFPSVQRSFGNGAIIAMLSTSISIALALPAAYSIARSSTGLGKLFLILALITRLIPSGVRWNNRYSRTFARLDSSTPIWGWHWRTPTIGVPIAIWLLSSFLESIPQKLEEAARVDGCSRFGALFRIIIPVAAGEIAISAVFVFLSSWNDFLFSLLLSSTGVKTTPIAIAEFKSQYGIQWGTMTSLSVLYSLPVIAFSLLVQRRIVAGVTLGAVKG